MKVRHIYHIRRKEKKIPMEKVANYIGCSQSMVSRYETGDCAFSDFKLKKYKEYIDNYNPKK
ncbi:helix-turn-helix domain-containing protein [Salibacterium lacus]|uniref:Helix-turn-helix domain-containing protein n=1 Tax=Salibacterium lacus TaxID=1898109 RepID=A0ABW5SZ76_9BACI